MDNTNEKETKGMSIEMLITVIAIDIVIFVIWGIGAYKDDGKIAKVMAAIPETLGNIATFSATIFGVDAVRRGVFNRGGTKYYPTQYGPRKLKNILNKYKKCDNYYYDKVCQKINELSKRHSEITGEIEYFKYVFLLQDKSEDFRKVWNDFNFYSNELFREEPKIKEYYNQLKKYIYMEVYNEYKNNLKKDEE